MNPDFGILRIQKNEYWRNMTPFFTTFLPSKSDGKYVIFSKKQKHVVFFFMTAFPQLFGNIFCCLKAEKKRRHFDPAFIFPNPNDSPIRIREISKLIITTTCALTP